MLMGHGSVLTGSRGLARAYGLALANIQRICMHDDHLARMIIILHANFVL